LPLIVKLSPNVTDVTKVAAAVESAGADAISLINSLIGMAVDIYTQRPVLGNIVGGLTGPAIKPVALYMVWRVARTVKVPIIGIGGIMRAEDAIEFILAGARAVGVGLGNFIKPTVMLDIIQGIEDYLINKEIYDVNDLVGSLKLD